MGFAIPLAVFAAYNARVTGSAFVPPRFDRVNTNADAMPHASFDERIAVHLSHNTMLLAVYMLGPLALPLAAIGALRKQPHWWVLGGGFVGLLALMLGHDNIGIHTVGPIHLSDAAPTLTILVVGGLHSIERWLAPVVSAAAIRLIGLGYVVLGIGLAFNVPWSLQLQRHGAFVSRPYELLASKGVHDAIVIAPTLFQMRPPGTIGSWQLHMPHPDPFLEDDLVFALYGADPDALHELYPQRDVVRIVVDPRTRAMDVLELHEGSR